MRKAVSCGFLTGCLFAFNANQSTTIAEEPRIYLIELANPNFVLLHFNTDPKRTYTLQYLDVIPSQVSLSANRTTNSYFGKWTNFAVVPAIPFTNHYIFADTRTNQVRFYRLLATP